VRAAHVALAVCAVACRYRFDVVADVDGGGDDGTTTPTAITVMVSGHGVALVEGQPPCANRCTYDVGAIDVSPWAGEAWQFAGFSEPACSTATTCSVAPGATVNVSFTPSPITANRMFISSMNVPRTGLAGLDTTCTDAATAAGLGGTFVAFASTSTVDARSRLGSARGWVAMNGLPVIDTVADFDSATRPRAPMFTELGGRNLIPAATGSNADGTKSVGNMCGDWLLTTGNRYAGYANEIDVYTVSFVSGSCANSSAVYCMQTDFTTPVSLTYPPAPMGRYVFVTGATFPVGGGIAAADLRCQNDATAAGLPGSYAALLATSTMSAADHVGGLAGMWRRTDGLVVSFTGLDQEPLDAAISLAATGLPGLGNYGMLGALSPTALGTATCSDWTDSAMTQRLDMNSRSLRPFTGLGSPPNCASLSSIFCAQLP
jgi:hypothetical protein